MQLSLENLIHIKERNCDLYVKFYKKNQVIHHHIKCDCTKHVLLNEGKI